MPGARPARSLSLETALAEASLGRAALRDPKNQYHMMSAADSFNVVQPEFFENGRAAALYARRENLKTVGKPVDRTEWGMSPPTVNSYYSAANNEIVFPAGRMQPPFFQRLHRARRAASRRAASRRQAHDGKLTMGENVGDNAGVSPGRSGAGRATGCFANIPFASSEQESCGIAHLPRDAT
jgi:hypothetical protein